MTSSPRPFLFALLLLSLIAAPSLADVRLPHLISSNMVLQRDMEDAIWGWADPGEKVTVTFNDKTAAAAAGADGKWAVKIGPFAAGGPFVMQVQGKNTLTLKNILVGEVWLCAGQSNMTFALAGNPPAGGVVDSAKVIAAADFPKIRFIGVPADVASKPVEDVPGMASRECSPKTIGGFSAVGYLFGRDVHTGLGVPVGLIQAGVNDTRAEYYMSRQALKSDPDFQVVFDRWEHWKKDHKVDVDFPNIDEDFGKAYHERDDMVHQYLRQAQAAQKAGNPVPPAPAYVAAWNDNVPGQWRMVKNFPTGQYYGVICPVIPFGMRGVVWYQGEANAGSPFLYPKLLAALIKSWRQQWGEGDFPFLIVQLPRARGNPSYVEIRYSQFEVFRSVPNVGLAVTCDIAFDPGQKDLVHTPQKEPVGHRLALIALANVYHKDLACYGPMYKSAARQGNAIRVAFDYATGLTAAGGGDLSGFVIAGADKKFVPAKAVVDHDALIISSPDVPQPVSVRYDWDNEPTGNLTNASGLPASPFRQDDWPVIAAAAPPPAK